MERIACEVCNSDHIVKEGEYFICESCGARYKVEDLRKMVLGTVEVVPGENALKKMYDDADFLLSINKLDEALNAYKKITEAFPREYRPWLKILDIDIIKRIKSNEHLPRWKDSLFHEVRLREIPREEVHAWLREWLDKFKEMENEDDSDFVFHMEYDYDLDREVYGNTCNLRFLDKCNWTNSLYIPLGLRVYYNSGISWIRNNALFFKIVAEMYFDYEFIDKFDSFIKHLYNEGVLIHDFISRHFSMEGFENYLNFYHNHARRFYNGKELGFEENDWTYEKKYPDFNEKVEKVWDINLWDLYLDVLKESDYQMKNEKMMEHLTNREIIKNKYKSVYIWNNFLIISPGTKESHYKIGIYINCDLNKMVEKHKKLYEKKQIESKEKGICPWCGEAMDYSVAPFVCSKCRTRVEGV